VKGRKPSTLILLRSKQAGSKPESLSLLQAAKTVNFWMLFPMWFLYGYSFYTITTHLIPHAVDLDIATTTAASMLSLIGGASIIGSILIGRVSDSMGRKQSMIGCSLLVAVASSP